MRKLKILFLVVGMLALCPMFAAAQSPPEQSLLSVNYKIDTAGKTAPIATYIPFQVKELFGSKLDFQIWTFGGVTVDNGSLLGGGALVLHTPIAKNLWINVGVDVSVVEGKRPVFAGIVGFEILRF